MISIMPEVVFGVAETWKRHDFISICFLISTREAGASAERILPTCIRGWEGGELTGNSTLNIRLVTCAFLINDEVS